MATHHPICPARTDSTKTCICVSLGRPPRRPSSPSSPKTPKRPGGRRG